MGTKAVHFSPTRMRKARLRQGWSQEDLARRTGQSLGSVGRWERGDHKPPGEAVAAIAKATGHDIDFFYVEGDSADDEEEAALRKQARDLVAPFAPGMLEVLMEEARLRLQSTEAVA